MSLLPDPEHCEAPFILAWRWWERRVLRQLPRQSPWRRTELIPLSVQIKRVLRTVLPLSRRWASASQERSCCPSGAVLLSLQMTEGRHCQVHLLDDRNLELLVQVKTPLFLGTGCTVPDLSAYFLWRCYCRGLTHKQRLKKSCISYWSNS